MSAHIGVMEENAIPLYTSDTSYLLFLHVCTHEAILANETHAD